MSDRRLTDQQSLNRAEPKGGYRARRKLDMEQILCVLEQLEAGRTMSEMADEIGVTTCTVRAWKRQHEGHLLRRENLRLKNELERLNAT